jgi:hypothetical protein
MVVFQKIGRDRVAPPKDLMMLWPSCESQLLRAAMYCLVTRVVRPLDLLERKK